MKRLQLACDACGEAIYEDNYCDGHRDGCANYHGYAADVPCDCDIHYHPECCPDCQAEDDAAEDAAWREFVANELMSEEAERLGL